jgi:nucleoside-diphosphate-sugar epimerase
MNELVRRGEAVRMVNRRGSMDEAPAGVEIVAGDVYDAQSVRSVAAGADVIYQCAQPGYTQWPAKFPPLQAAVIEALSGSDAKLVIAENLYMYGEVKGPIHEGLPYAARTRKGKVRAQMSEAALAAHQAGKVRVALGRGSDFFGPWALGSSVGGRVFYPALAGKAAQIAGDPDAPHTVTYIEDFGRALVILGERDEALGQAWHVPNHRPALTQRAFVELVCAEAGQPPKLSAMGRTMMRLGGLFVPAAREVAEMMYEFEQPFVVDSSKFETAFGVRATPVKEAIQATVAWYRAHPEQKL